MEDIMTGIRRAITDEMTGIRRAITDEEAGEMVLPTNLKS